MYKKYDIIIIGSGIGGLICGCYLAKAGLKILVIEQHKTAGGYCSSFQRQGYHFDTGVHYLGGIRKGVLGEILRELGLIGKLKLNFIDPVDTIIMPDFEIHIWNRIEATVDEFSKIFPGEEKKIRKFFNLISLADFLPLYKKYSRETFDTILNEFFANPQLKATLNVLLANLGYPANKTSALAAIVLFREYILDSGHYPVGGMQSFTQLLVDFIKQKGCDFIFSRHVRKILLKNGKTEGVIIDGDAKIHAPVIVSDVAAAQLYQKLIPVKSKESGAISCMAMTPSVFLVYLGLKDSMHRYLKYKSNIWYFSSYRSSYYLQNVKAAITGAQIKWINLSFPSLHDVGVNGVRKETMTLLTLAHWDSLSLWKKLKPVLTTKMIDKASELFPDLRNMIDVIEVATPHTLNKYTLNTHGAFAGWLPTLKRTQGRPLIPQRSSIKRLYLTGHWCNIGYLPGCGIPNVALSGRRASRLIFDDLGYKWPYSMLKM